MLVFEQFSPTGKSTESHSWKRHDRLDNNKYNKKTARVCFWSENITRVLFLAGKGTRPRPRKARVLFSVYHMPPFAWKSRF
jgi:hypothetical protein